MFISQCLFLDRSPFLCSTWRSRILCVPKKVTSLASCSQINTKSQKLFVDKTFHFYFFLKKLLCGLGGKLFKSWTWGWWPLSNLGNVVSGKQPCQHFDLHLWWHIYSGHSFHSWYKSQREFFFHHLVATIRRPPFTMLSDQWRIPWYCHGIKKKSRNELLIPSRSWNLSDIDPDFFLVWCDTWAGYYIEVVS